MTTVERRTVVPWVALWSRQMDALNAQWDVHWSTHGLATPGWPVMFGCTWKFYPSLYRGQGRPMFSQIDTQRHIQAMRGPRCQVCGVKLPKTNTPWLITQVDDTLADIRDGRYITPTAPTCEACWPTAERLCPHLVAEPPRRLIVPSYRLWGVSGKLYRPGDREGELGSWSLGHELLPWVLGSQLRVELEGVTLP